VVSVNEVNEFLKTIAPIEMKEDYDNVGFLVGRAGADASKILVSLDITSNVITEALETGAGLIVSHHPLFTSLKSVTDTDTTGKKIVQMLSGGLSAICMHTNLDSARGGTNDALAEAAGISGPWSEPILLSEEKKLPSGEAYYYGRVGHLEAPCSFSRYLEILKKALGAYGLRYFDAGREVHKVAVVCGSGGDLYFHAVSHGCDTFISSDIKYSVFLEAAELGFNLIFGGHYCTENLVMSTLASRLRAAFPDTEVNISKVHRQTVRFY